MKTGAAKKRLTRGKPKSTHVPGQYLGYSLQTTRCLAHLLNVKGMSNYVSLEVFEDVGVEDSEGNRIAEQNKSALESNPVSDRAVGFWKTFYNWINAIEAGELDPEKTTFIIHVAQNKRTNIAKKFSAATTVEAAEAALNEAIVTLWGASPNYKLKNKVAGTIREYVSKVFTTSRPLICKLISRFTLEFGNESTHTKIRGLLQTRVATELVEYVYLHALGWVKNYTDSLLEQSKLAIIPAREFYNNLNAYISRVNTRLVLESFVGAPDRAEIDSELARVRTFVRQLDLIEYNDVQKIKAVSNFLRASADRTEWSKLGLVHSSSFNEFEERLTNIWENEKTIIDITHIGLDDKKKGTLLCAKCCIAEVKLQGFSCPPHFTPGSFHSLADSPSDHPLIGWHPNYNIKLKEI